MTENGQTGSSRGDLHWSTERMSSIGDTLHTAAHGVDIHRRFYLKEKVTIH